MESQPNIQTLLPDRAALALMFWNSPDESLHAPEVIEAATGIAENTLQDFRSNTPGGPKFVKRGRKVWYAKGAIVSWMKSEADAPK